MTTGSHVVIRRLGSLATAEVLSLPEWQAQGAPKSFSRTCVAPRPRQRSLKSAPEGAP